MKNKNIFDDIYSKYQEGNDILLITMDFPFYLNSYIKNTRLKLFCDSQMYRVSVDKRISKYSSFINDNIGEYYSKKALVNGMCQKAIEEGLRILIYTDSEEKYSYLKNYIMDYCQGLNIDGLFDTIDKNRINEIPKYNVDILIFDVNEQKYLEILFCYFRRNNLARIAIPLNNFRKSKSSFKNVVNYFFQKIRIKINKRLNKKKKKLKGSVAAWFYLPQTTAETIATYKILKNSDSFYDVITSQSTICNYEVETIMLDSFAQNTKVEFLPEEAPVLWCREATKLFLENADKYDFLMTRVMPTWGHDVGLQVKQKRPHTFWIASFGDPMYNNPYRMDLIAREHFNKAERNLLFKNYEQIFKSKDKKFDCFQPLKEERVKVLEILEKADLMLFNNVNQMKWMLGESIHDYKEKCHVLFHSFDKEFYFIPEYQDDGKRKEKYKFLFLGHSDLYRNLDTFIEGLNNLIQENKEYGEKIDVELIGNIHYENLDKIRDYGMEHIFCESKQVDYLTSLDLMQEADVLLHVDVKFDFMGSHGIFYASKLSDYLGAKKKILALSIKDSITFELMRTTNNYYCDVDNIEEIQITIKDILDGKERVINYKNYEMYNAKHVMKEYDSFFKKLIK